MVDAAGKDSWMIAETDVAEEMVRFAVAIVADLEARGDHSLLGRVVFALGLLAIMVHAAVEHYRDFEIS